MFKPQTKHKANHGGYKGKPSKQSVNATLLMYMGCNEVIKQMEQSITPNGTQLKLEL